MCLEIMRAPNHGSVHCVMRLDRRGVRAKSIDTTHRASMPSTGWLVLSKACSGSLSASILLPSSVPRVCRLPREKLARIRPAITTVRRLSSTTYVESCESRVYDQIAHPLDWRV